MRMMGKKPMKSPGVPTELTPEVAAEVDRLFAEMHELEKKIDDCEPPQKSTLARRYESRNAHCARCRRVLGPGEAVWRLRAPLGPSFYYHQMRMGIVSSCEACISKDLTDEDPSIDELRNHRLVEDRPCDTCGRHVLRVKGRTPTLHCFCSRNCEAKYWTAVQREKRFTSRQKECCVCGVNFVAARRDAQTCSAACRQKAYRLQRTNRP